MARVPFIVDKEHPELAELTARIRGARGGRLINMVGAGEFFGDMAYIWGGELPRQM